MTRTDLPDRRAPASDNAEPKKRRSFCQAVTRAAFRSLVCILAFGCVFFAVDNPRASADPSATVSGDQVRVVTEFVESYCLDCHNADDAVGGLDLETTPIGQASWDEATGQWPAWENIYKRVASRQMPPADAYRPDNDEYVVATQALAGVLDGVAESKQTLTPNDSMRRLTRTEYQNSVRDLLDIEIDATRWIPKDESSHGFDNITVGELSPALMSRYLTAAEKISRIAVARPTGTPMGLTVRLPADLTQEHHLPGLPLGTRGGTNIRHTFAESGVYEIAVRLTRDRDEMVEGLYRPHDLDVLVDRHRHHRFHIQPPENGKDFTHVDTNLKVRVPITAGPHDIAVTFVSQGESLREIKRQPFDAAYNRHRHPRQQPALFEVSMVGPLNDSQSAPNKQLVAPETTGPVDTPSRQRIFTVRPDDDSLASQVAAAEIIFAKLLRHAYRREIGPDDLAVPMKFFRDAVQTTVTTSESATVSHRSNSTADDRFEFGIQRGIAAILVNPHFLFRIERPAETAGLHRVSDTELASRLSYFLYASLPDEGLLDLAASNQLSDAAVLDEQVRRMLDDPRSDSLVTNFAAQWLYLKNLDGVKPDLRRFPDFDENLRRAFRTETESLFRHIKEHGESVLGLIDSDFTYLNERLAVHYEIPGVVGSHFRRVDLSPDSNRGGLLRHGSILAVTSYSTRTSPTIRGNWVLENLVGTPPPPPPPDVPALKEKQSLTDATFRQRLAAHRENPACASCHALIDPVGFSLDHYDAVGRYRRFDADDTPVDSSGTLPDGTEVTGVKDLEASLTRHPEMFVTCLVEKMLTYALGRGLDHRDAAAVRRIVSESAQDDYRFSSIVRNIVASRPFQSRYHPPKDPS
ncbi:hypothetical protein Mal65_21640 [Crateriforma conspicua]|nr:hypothetical protein Mal65_21640 [Crateriforma conspicua]